MSLSPVFRWERPFVRQVLRLAIPIMIQSIVAALMHIVDNVMVGQLGPAALAGVTQANRIAFLYQLTMFGISSGAAVFTAQFWGKKDIKNIRHVMGLGLLFTVGIALLFAIPAMLMPGTLMRALIKDPAAQAEGVKYLRIMGAVYVVQGLSLLLSSVLKSTEKVRLPMIASVVAISTNTLLNYCLIFGRFGLPRLGVEGAAIATLIGATLELVLLLGVGYYKKYAIAAKPHELKVPGRDFVKRYLRVVLPVLANESFWALGILMYSVVYGRMENSSVVVSAVSIYNNIEQLASVVLRGVTHAAAVMIGMCIGAEDYDGAKLYAKRFLWGSAMVGLVAGGGVVLMCDVIFKLYSEIPAGTLEIARHLIYIYAAFLWMKSTCTQVIVGVLRPGGDVVFSMVLDALPVWVIGVPLVAIFGLVVRWPIEYVYALTLIEECLKVFIGVMRVRSGKWIRNLTRA